jgi:hypothetical protein
MTPDCAQWAEKCGEPDSATYNLITPPRQKARPT